jgi:hypothetical protein
MAATPINKKQPGDSGYIFFYGGREIALYAPSIAAAKDKAVEHFKAPKSKRHMVHGMIAEDSSGKAVVHSTASV